MLKNRSRKIDYINYTVNKHQFYKSVLRFVAEEGFQEQH